MNRKWIDHRLAVANGSLAREFAAALRGGSAAPDVMIGGQNCCGFHDHEEDQPEGTTQVTVLSAPTQ